MRDFIDTQQIKLKTILEDAASYVIPKFQREYSWQDEQIEEFWKDLIEHYHLCEKDPYFFGTLVLIADQNKREKFKVVDGQQRLTTSITFLTVIRDFLYEFNKDRDVENIQYYLEAEDVGDSNYKYRLKLSRNNQDFFVDKILKLDNASNKNQIIFNNISKRNKGLATAYALFYNKISGELDKIPDQNEKIQFLIGLANHFVKYFVVVRNVIDTPERAYRIFDSINNRGIRLEESDLVKNYLLEKIDHGGGDVDEWYNKWLEILNRLDNANVKEADFLRHYLMAYYAPTGPKEVFERVLHKIKTREQVEEFIDHVLSAAQVYRKLKDPQKEDWFNESNLVEDLITFNSLTAKVIYPVLLKGFDLFGNDRKIFSEFVHNLLIFFFRSRTICKTSATSLEALMNDVCKKLRNDSSITVKDVKKFLRDSKQYCDNEAFRFNFSNFDANQKNAIYILTNLNTSLHGGKKEMTLSAQKDNISIEHIMPKVIKDSEWEIYLKNKKGFTTKLELEDYHKNNLWKIGNLTILNRSKNFKTQNISFIEKCNQAYKTDDAKIVNHICNWPEWNDQSISQRQEMLAEQASKIWNLDD
ncbi:hypothetical protein C6988_02490 [Nitrosopumilus sp. b1]|uniref:DUF262 domain-containing protein n=1 Tax=Nitrosopumilus sp. b1 TaxID=2109907 RepID=UPI0015F775C2|nr:DUF262 domain-containing protein [Nitrosopumilus sp. b1]KAF6243630.1 hypothetical protein C6988_02490 [Nitrosopumilus sp. b1]